jgi:glycosyl-4,4'-diaponeurosporenoate acyltransferase
MLKNLSFINMLLWNVLIIGLWHTVIFIACIKIPVSSFNPEKGRFVAKSWEHGGRWYRNKLKIHEWKDKLPQYIGKGDFSKRHLKDLSINYLNMFIEETCRGEWMHMKNCICSVIVLIINPMLVGITASFLIIIGNLPFALVQRYNRFRLQVLKKRLMRELQSNGLRKDTVTA